MSRTAPPRSSTHTNKGHLRLFRDLYDGVTGPPPRARDVSSSIGQQIRIPDEAKHGWEGKLCWKTQGDLRKAFHDILPLLDKELDSKLNEAPGKARVIIELYMIGTSKKDCKPVVAFICNKRECAEQAQHIIKKSKILKISSHFKRTTILPILPNGDLLALVQHHESEGMSTSFEEAKDVYMDVSAPFKLSGMPIFIKHGERYRKATATAMRINEEFFFLTAAHAFDQPWTKSEWCQTFKLSIDSGSESETESGSEYDDEENDTSIYTHPKISAEDLVSSSSVVAEALPPGQFSVYDNTVGRPIPLTYQDKETEERIIEPEEPQYLNVDQVPNGLVCIGELWEHSIDKDWALVYIADSKSLEILLSHAHTFEVVSSLLVGDPPAHTQAQILTSHGSITVTMSGEFTSMRFVNGSSSVKILHFEYEGELRRGDSGSMAGVWETALTKIWGHFVAVIAGTNSGYIISGQQLMDDISYHMKVPKEDLSVSILTSPAETTIHARETLQARQPNDRSVEDDPPIAKQVPHVGTQSEGQASKDSGRADASLMNSSKMAELNQGESQRENYLQSTTERFESTTSPDSDSLPHQEPTSQSKTNRGKDRQIVAESSQPGRTSDFPSPFDVYHTLNAQSVHNFAYRGREGEPEARSDSYSVLKYSGDNYTTKSNPVWHELRDEQLGAHSSLQSRTPERISDKGRIENLDPSYMMRTGFDARRFFVKGRVFSMVWVEPASETWAKSAATNLSVTMGRYGQGVFSQIRSFIVVAVKRGFVYAIGITTYGDRGTLKPGCRPAEHAAVYFSGSAPYYLPGEREAGLTKEPIEILPADSTAIMRPSSRLRFGKTFPIEWNIKVKDIGQVIPAHMSRLISYWKDEDRSDEATNSVEAPLQFQQASFPMHGYHYTRSDGGTYSSYPMNYTDPTLYTGYREADSGDQESPDIRDPQVH